MIEKDGKKLIWDSGHPMRMDCITCRPMEHISKKMILLIDMTYSKEYSKVAKRDEKIEVPSKYQQLLDALEEE